MNHGTSGGYTAHKKADETFVPRIGAARRIEALLALGWTHAHMRATSGVNTAVVLHQDGEWITVRNHARIVAMYDELSMTLGPSARTRGRVAKLGYAPPLAWDEEQIDNPKARPHGSSNRVIHERPTRRKAAA